MDGIFEFLGFSLGAGLAIRAITALGEGLRPLARGAMRTGMAMTARGGEDDALRADANGASAGDTTPRQIIIARE